MEEKELRRRGNKRREKKFRRGPGGGTGGGVGWNGKEKTFSREELLWGILRKRIQSGGVMERRDSEQSKGPGKKCKKPGASSRENGTF